MTRSRRSKSAVAVAIILLVVAFVWFWLRCPADPGNILLVECFHQGGNAANDIWWEFRLDGKGNGTLTTSPGTIRARTRPIFAPKFIAQLQAAIGGSILCELHSQIGQAVPDGSTDQMRIQTEKINKTIRMQFVDPGEVDNQVRRARQLWKIIEDDVVATNVASGS